MSLWLRQSMKKWGQIAIDEIGVDMWAAKDIIILKICRKTLDNILTQVYNDIVTRERQERS